MRRLPLSLQIAMVLLFSLGIALGAGFYPSLLLESRQLEREQEAGMANLAVTVTMNVAARVRHEVDEAGYRAALARMLSVPSLERQLVSLQIVSPDPTLTADWSNFSLAYLKDAAHGVTVERPASSGRNIPAQEGGQNQSGPRRVTIYPDVQTVRVFVKGEQKEDLATITLEVSKLKAKAQAAQIKRMQASALGLSVLLILGTSLLMIRQISNPVRKLLGAMDRLAGGNFDVDLQPTGAREIRKLISAFNQMALGLKDKERLRMELQAARAVQTYLLPRESPAIQGFVVDALCVPASEVGGDFYQFFPDGSGGLSFVIGDVSGKGMKAAMLTSLALGALHPIVKETHEPVTVLSKLNDVLCEEIQDYSFVTCLFGHLDARSGLFAFANAGHLYPYRYSARTASWEEVELPLDRFPVGIFRDVHYQAGAITLQPGDSLLLLSDGVVEARNESGAILGDERLEAILREASSSDMARLAPFVMGKMALFQGGALQADDITMISIQRQHSS